MAEKEKLNIIEKVILARQDFLAKRIQKSGLHNGSRQFQFKYYELEDIVPTATEIFSKYGLLFTVDIKETEAIGTFTDSESESKITFTVPFFIWQTFPSGMNAVQALGAQITYYRRYLYMVALDIVEQDQIDSLPDKPTVTSAPVASKSATPEQRAEIKAELTSADNQASELQVKSLKNALKALKQLLPDSKDYIKELLSKTNSLKSLSKADCENYITEIIKKMKEIEDKQRNEQN